MNKNSKLTWGVILLLVGIVFLLQQLHILTPTIKAFIFDIRNILIALGIILIATSRRKTIGIVLCTVGGVLYLKDLIVWTQTLSNLLWPLLLMIAGIYLLLSSSNKRWFGNKKKR